MQYDEIAHLRTQHPAWVLLRSDNAALVLSFLGRVFVDANSSDLPSSSVLADELDDELYALNRHLGESRFPRSATAYLDDWAGAGHGWLRKYYPPGSDEAHYDLAPAVEKVAAVGRTASLTGLRWHRVTLEHRLRAAPPDGVRGRRRP